MTMMVNSDRKLTVVILLTIIMGGHCTAIVDGQLQFDFGKETGKTCGLGWLCGAMRKSQVKKCPTFDRLVTFPGLCD